MTSPPDRHLVPRIWRPADLEGYDGPLLLDTHVWIWHVEGDASRMAPGTTPRDLSTSPAHMAGFGE